ncbi:IS607 family transposase [Candidatus Dojkabacteria bacterium]|jgi:predicted site-specific integrase-resolvase|nr:IS607 family transposase [Candidatus Dojkabacteria bacterium]
MKLSEWSKKEGINYRTAWNWFKAGKLPVESYQTETGTIIVKEKDVIKENDNIKECIIYCRVSSHDKKDDLERQKQRCTDFAISNGFKIIQSYKEIGSGMNDGRTQLIKVLNSNIPYIIVENKDRLTRFGFNYIKVLFNRLNINIIVINHTDDDKQDLMKDLISIITSFCGRIYGLRRAHTMAINIKNNII